MQLFGNRGPGSEHRHGRRVDGSSGRAGRRGSRARRRLHRRRGGTHTSNPYATYITGTLTNNKDTDVSYVQIEYVLYDADGAQIGTALANTSNLKAGGVWKFEAVAMVEPANVASYERADITGF